MHTLRIIKSSKNLKSPSPIRLYSSNQTNQTTTYLSSLINNFLSNQTTNLQNLQKSHGYIITTGNSNNHFISAKLMSFYASLRLPNSSSHVFESFTSVKDTFLWNSIIKSHFFNGDYLKSLEFYSGMRVLNYPPDHFTVPMAVSSCAELKMLSCGRVVHGLAFKLGVFVGGNTAVGSSLVYMYSKCAVMNDAAHVFEEISVKDVVAWTALIIGYVNNDDYETGLKCFCEMHKIGAETERPNFRTLEGVFQACGNLGAILEGRCLHGLVVKNGIFCSPLVQSSVLVMYSKCETIEEAYIAFCEVSDKDINAWTSIIGVYGRLGHVRECIDMFLKMQVVAIYPDGVVISCVLSGLGNSMNVLEGKAFHGFILRRNYVLDKMVTNALISMYCRFGLLKLADKLLHRGDACCKEPWNIMVSAYSKVRVGEKCLELFREIKHRGIETDSNTLVPVISSCSQLGVVRLGQSAHGYTIKSSINENVSVANSLIDMYGKCGKLSTAFTLFRRTQRDIVSWNTLMSVYIHSGNPAMALTLLDKLILEDLKPNSATFVTLLSACSNLASLENGEKIHKYIETEKFDINVPISTALIDMYAKCGKLEKSREIFNAMIEKDVISWNSMISGYGLHGDLKSALKFFDQMEKSNVKPNGLTFLVLLSACAYAGLIEKGKDFFGRMSKYSITPNLKHYACMVDLLGRHGELEEAEALVMSMPMAPDKGVWGALLNACVLHDENEMGIRIAKNAIEANPENDGYYIMSSNMYSSIGRWDEAKWVRERMQAREVKKTVGWSAVQCSDMTRQNKLLSSNTYIDQPIH